MWTNIHARVHQTLKDSCILPHKSNLLIAVSGGQDSLCLLKIMIDLQEKWGWNIAIAHCDHGWASDLGIADHVEKIANNWNIPFYLKVAKAMKETEAAAREWRYQSLVEIAEENDCREIVTGHTLSDRSETLLYNLIRGAGSNGLGALTWKRPLTNNINLVRPLLKVSRGETLEFCQQFALPIWEDAANANLDYARNRIRQELVPYLKENFNPNVETTLSQTSEVLKAESDYLEAEANKILLSAVNDHNSKLNREVLKGVPLALQRRVIRQFLAKIMVSKPNFEQIEETVNLIDAPRKSRTSSFPGKIMLEVEENYIVQKRTK
ncbi:tRNA lysidine(34) synthetase TilS [Crocosphaera watsonii WH 8501]|uniref:tRNA(Ile)-lysidine synthase n=5 Tax=Crocosphaera watsonii TaxID=263511 RepID=Q4BZ71_CROWT|nr:MULTISPECIES: tRNA lysidine(34) synthetase TilS [Crocosphaera]EAM49206.1 PP-loop [Crocosphaera watsonii WH 8501]EHJ11080.1 tRNA(Ile)-lysidine synthetase [Crocosphaera watsonii WH 0003]NQZ60954.1 tRNA lysidine(34) synthetase TilS [Crocosphaera sp.]CCQ48779.1 tRNA(Ile)-lysidine synthetase [Crocosphaera watsonii WH 8502]CCQ59199.1 tRNA(Ile)-lysidine synthetase [Crocosphaera watsonii WH 0005]